jgi:PII-like signaling protein
MADAEQEVLMRIHVGEGDRYARRPLSTAIVEFLLERGCVGATVYRGEMGFGGSRRLGVAGSEYMATNLPIVIECVDTDARLASVRPVLDTMITSGLVTFAPARVVARRAAG